MSAPKSKPLATKKPKGTRAGTAVPLSTIVGFGSVAREQLDCEDFAIDCEGRIYYATRATDGGGDVNSTILNSYEFPPLASGLSPRPRSSAAPAPQYGAIVKQQSPRKEFRMSQYDFPPLPNAISEQEHGDDDVDDEDNEVDGDYLVEIEELDKAAVGYCDADDAEYEQLGMNTELQSLTSTVGATTTDWPSISELMSACEINMERSLAQAATNSAQSNNMEVNPLESCRDETAATTTSYCDGAAAFNAYKASQARRGTGKVLPANEYGLLGLMPLLRNQPSSSAQAMLTFGYSYDELGIDMNSPTPLYERLVTCLSDKPLMPPGQPIPEEYTLSAETREKMPSINLKQSSEDTVFFVFYNVQENLLQVEAAEELYARGWRFHKLQRVWLCRRSDAPFEQYGSFVTSMFVMFDHVQWTKIEKEMEINLEQLEEKPDPSQFKPKINAVNGCFSWKPNFHANFFQEQQNIGSVRPPPGFAPRNLDYDKHLDSLLEAQRVAMEAFERRQQDAASRVNIPPPPPPHIN